MAQTRNPPPGKTGPTQNRRPAQGGGNTRADQQKKNVWQPTPPRRPAPDMVKKPPSAARQAARFAFHPELGRSFDGVKSAFGLLINLVAQLFISAKLIDRDHPCGDLRYAADYKLTDIIGIAYRNLRWEKSQTPQIVMFFAIIGFLVFMALSVVTIAMQMIMGVAHAQPINPATGPNIASNLLNSLFNITGDGMIPRALGAMLGVYSKAMLVLAGIILIFMTLSSVAETAQTGVPFGKNFNTTWAPVRLIFAIALLVPLSGGLNSGQYIVLHLVKFGSDQASLVWKTFAGFTRLEQLGANKFWTPAPVELVDNILSWEFCNAEANSQYPGSSVYERDTRLASGSQHFANGPQVNTFTGTGGEKVEYVEYKYTGTSAGDQKGCGSIKFPYLARLPLADNGQMPSGMSNIWSSPSEFLMHARHKLFVDLRARLKPIAENINGHFDPSSPNYFEALPAEYRLIREEAIRRANDQYRSYANQAQRMVEQRIGADLEAEMTQMGWLGAPIWFHKIAQLNSDTQVAAMRMPLFLGINTDMAKVIAGQKELQIRSTSGYGPGAAQEELDAKLRKIGNNDFNASTVANVIDDMIERMAKLIGINDGEDFLAGFQLTSNNPIGEIAIIGQRIFFWGTVMIKAFVLSAVGSALPFVGGIAAALAPIMTVLITALLGAGIMMGFIAPLTPVLRFVSGILSWIMLTLQALFAMPLVALAHLSTQGDGLWGQKSQGAYFTLLGIVLKPILMILGLIGGLLAFNLIIGIINFMFIPLLKATYATDEMNFFHFIVFVSIYAFFVFATANSAMKMVDIVPTQVMSWIGASMPDQGTRDDVEQLTKAQAASIGIMYKGMEPIAQNLSKAGGAMNKLAQSRIKNSKDKNTTKEGATLGGGASMPPPSGDGDTADEYSGGSPDGGDGGSPAVQIGPGGGPDGGGGGNSRHNPDYSDYGGGSDAPPAGGNAGSGGGSGGGGPNAMNASTNLGSSAAEPETPEDLSKAQQLKNRLKQGLLEGLEKGQANANAFQAAAGMGGASMGGGGNMGGMSQISQAMMQQAQTNANLQAQMEKLMQMIKDKNI